MSPICYKNEQGSALSKYINTVDVHVITIMIVWEVVIVWEVMIVWEVVIVLELVITTTELTNGHGLARSQGQSPH